MGPWRRRTAPPPSPPVHSLPLAEVVPQRAVLTELARGFLLVNGSDPNQALKFASTFLRERSGPPPATRSLPPNRLASVRRGVDAALRTDER